MKHCSAQHAAAPSSQYRPSPLRQQPDWVLSKNEAYLKMVLQGVCVFVGQTRSSMNPPKKNINNLGPQESAAVHNPGRGSVFYIGSVLQLGIVKLTLRANVKAQQRNMPLVLDPSIYAQEIT